MWKRDRIKIGYKNRKNKRKDFSGCRKCKKGAGESYLQCLSLNRIFTFIKMMIRRGFLLEIWSSREIGCSLRPFVKIWPSAQRANFRKWTCSFSLTEWNKSRMVIFFFIFYKLNSKLKNQRGVENGSVFGYLLKNTAT